jgi:junction plakoglobin
MQIFRTGGIPALIRMLGSPIDPVVYYAITTLHNLIMYQDGAKSEVRKYAGVEAMVPLLTRDQEKFLAILADCLCLLAAQNQQSKVLFT